MSDTEVKVPDIGDFKDVEVIEVLVKPGDTIVKDQSLITVESDKASMEIPSSAAGVVRELRVKLGDKVSQGTPIVLLDESQDERPATGVQPEALAASRLFKLVARRGVGYRRCTRHRVRCARLGCRPRWLLGGVSRSGSRQEDGSSRTLCNARRRVP